MSDAAADVAGISSTPPQTGLSKKERGRLKKLRKRAAEVKEGCELSGFTSLSDWQEYQSLQTKHCNSNVTVGSSIRVGPSLRLRKMNKGSGEIRQQRAEGQDHRDVLWKALQFLGGATTSRKRSRDEQQVSIPPWATFHHPCTLQSLAVLEIHLQENDESMKEPSWENVLSHVPILETLVSGNHKSLNAVAVDTRWFQGPHPKSISNVLMHLPRVPSALAETNTKKDNNTNDASTSTTLDEVVDLLQSLCLPLKKRRAEGYPIVLASGKMNEQACQTKNSSEFRMPSLNDAKEIVKCSAVSVEHDEQLSESDENLQNVVPFVTTVDLSRPERERCVFAMDCEMVKTSSGSELARFTLLRLTKLGVSSDQSVSYEVVCDELVKPYRPVLDYVTEFSGITAAKLETVTTRLEQLQAAVLSHVDRRDIIVGHSLENDLRSLHVVHDNVVDTAMLFRSKGGRKNSLRHLSRVLLNKTIQQGDSLDGHCSEEDASAALNLAVRRAIMGPSFCLRERGDDRLHFFEKVKQAPLVSVGPSQWLKENVIRRSGSAHALTCESIHDLNRKAVSAWLTSPKRRAKMVWSNWVVPVKSQKDNLDMLNNSLSDLVDSMLPGTLVLVAFQRAHGQSRELAAKRKVLMDPRSSLGWSASDEDAYLELVNYCRAGWVYWIGA